MILIIHALFKVRQSRFKVFVIVVVILFFENRIIARVGKVIVNVFGKETCRIDEFSQIELRAVSERNLTRIPAVVALLRKNVFDNAFAELRAERKKLLGEERDRQIVELHSNKIISLEYYEKLFNIINCKKR